MQQNATQQARRPQRFVKLNQTRFPQYRVAPPAGDLLALLRAPADGAAAEGAEAAGWETALAGIDAALTRAKAWMDAASAAGHDRAVRDTLRAVDLYSSLKHHVQKDRAGQAVTNAWLKIYEIVTQMHLLDGVETPKVFANAELPGAFVSGLNHYLQTRGRHMEWAASSLHPPAHGQHTVLGDHYGLYAHNRGRWLMDPEMVGDVTDVRNLAALADRAAAVLGGKADLYTSDAGIDVTDAYNDQEALTARIHLGQVVAGLMALGVGGALVVKTYTYTSPYSVAIAAVVAAAFEATYVVKPQTSRPTNAETYLVGVGYRGIPPEAVDLLLAGVEHYDYARPLIPARLLGPTGDSLAVAAQAIHGDQQVAFLSEAAELHRGGTAKLRGALHQVARSAQRAWLAANPVARLPDEGRLPANADGARR